MSRVSKMKLKDILEITDIILNQNDILYFCEDKDVVDEYIKKFNRKNVSYKDLKQFLIDNETSIDKEKLLLLLIINYRENIRLIMERMKEQKNKINKYDSDTKFYDLAQLKLQEHTQKNKLNEAIKLAKGIDTFFTIYYFEQKEKRYKIQVVDSKEVIEEKKINYQKEIRRFDQIDQAFRDENSKEQLGMEFAIQSILLTDLLAVFPNENFGNDVRTMILENEVLKQGVKSQVQLEKLRTLENYEEYTTLLDNIYYEGMLPDIKATLREYAQYIDLDKLLLISAYRFNEAMESGHIEPEVNLEVKGILLEILKNMKDPTFKISCELQRIVDQSYEMEKIEYSISDIKKCISQFTKKGYLSRKQIEEYRRKINNEEINLSQIDSEYIDIIFSLEELERLGITTQENLIYVSKRNKWDANKIIALYEEGSISIEDLSVLRETIDFTQNVSFEILNECYKRLINNPENEELFNKYNRYLELYKEILLKNKSIEELRENSNNAIEKVVENFEGKEYNAAIKNYFKTGVITIDSIAEWSNEEIILEFFYEKLISIEDIEKLAIKQKVTFDFLERICLDLIKNDEIEYDERLQLLKKGVVKQEDIFSLYRNNLLFESDLKELAENGLVEKNEVQRIISSRTMEELERNSNIRLTGLNNLTKKNNEIYSGNGYSIGTQERVGTGKLIIDPNKREEFIKLLRAYRAETDLEEESPFYNYEFYVIPDESGAIGLNSVVMAERYYEDKDTETRFATDNATYFFKYKDLMVLSNLSKLEMTKERKNIVFTSNHVIANGKRDGYWATSVIQSVVKTMLSLDLKEYSKENKNLIILEKLKEVYSLQEIMEILKMAEEIDSGKHICLIEEPIYYPFKKNEKKGFRHDNGDDGNR